MQDIPTQEKASTISLLLTLEEEINGSFNDFLDNIPARMVSIASESLRDLRIAEVAQLDMQLDDGKVIAYRARVKVSFKYEGGD